MTDEEKARLMALSLAEIEGLSAALDERVIEVQRLRNGIRTVIDDCKHRRWMAHDLEELLRG